MFNWRIYRELNQDLIKANLNTEKQIMDHWNKYGHKENRKTKITDLIPNFDIDEYKKLNPELKFNSQEEYELHCIKEQGNDSFNWKIYRELHQDLIYADLNTEEQIMNHWKKYGHKEKRMTKITDLIPDFDLQTYKKNKPDLKLNNREEYELYRIKEYMENQSSNTKFDIVLAEPHQVQPFGFIILRHVSKKEHDELWRTCYDSIRNFYEEPILIIDDNSNYSLISEKQLINSTVVNSEYKGSGEILPYFYFYKLKPFEKAIVLHDSMFIQKRIQFETINDIKFLWHFSNHNGDETQIELDYIQIMNNNVTLKNFYLNKNNWYGCFGVASVIDYNFVKLLHEKYNFFTLCDHIVNRQHRMALERMFACLCFLENKVSLNNCSIMGSIFNHHKSFGYLFRDYKTHKCNHDIIKVWSGR